MVNSPRAFKPSLNKDDEIIFSALFTIGFVAITQLMKVDVLDKPLTVALYCFAISLPFLSMMIYIKRGERDVNMFYTSVVIIFGYRLGLICAIAGMVSIFFHFSITIGIIFSISCLIALVGLVKFAEWRKDNAKPGEF